MNKIIIFVFLPFMVTFVLCMNYGMQPAPLVNWGGPAYAQSAAGYSGYGYGQATQYTKGQPVALQNVVYYPQLTPYYTPYGDQNEIDPLWALLGFLLLLYAFNISGINNG